MDCSNTDLIAWLGLLIGLFNLWNSHSEKKDRRQHLQSYLDIEGASISLVGNDLIGKLEIRNNGQSPALNIQYTVSLAIAELPINGIEFDSLNFPEPTTVQRAPLGPNGNFKIVFGMQLTNEDVASLKSHKKTVCLRGWLNYSDHFGNLGKTLLDCMQGMSVTNNSWALISTIATAKPRL